MFKPRGRESRHSSDLQMFRRTCTWYQKMGSASVCQWTSEWPKQETLGPDSACSWGLGWESMSCGSPYKMSRVGKSSDGEGAGVEGVCVLDTGFFPVWQRCPGAREDGGSRVLWSPNIRNAVNATDLNWKMAKGRVFMYPSVVPQSYLFCLGFEDSIFTETKVQSKLTRSLNKRAVYFLK